MYSYLIFSSWFVWPGGCVCTFWSDIIIIYSLKERWNFRLFISIWSNLIFEDYVNPKICLVEFEFYVILRSRHQCILEFCWSNMSNLVPYNVASQTFESENYDFVESFIGSFVEKRTYTNLTQNSVINSSECSFIIYL